MLLRWPAAVASCRRCTSPASLAGTFDESNGESAFRPASGCYLAIPTVEETRALLTGKWVFTCGGSNSWATFNTLARTLDPSAFPWRDERYDGTILALQPLWTDLIWEKQAGGSYALVHSSYVCSEGVACDGASSAWHVQAAALPAAVASTTIPQYSAAKHIRVTFAHGRLLTECNAHFNAALRDTSKQWAAAPKVGYVQAAVWYVNGYLAGLVPAARYE